MRGQKRGEENTRGGQAELGRKMCSQVELGNKGDEGYTYTVEEVFPKGILPKDVLKGARYREGLTQAQTSRQSGRQSQQHLGNGTGANVPSARKWRNGWPRY